MWPSASAYTKFCDGAPYSERLARKAVVDAVEDRAVDGRAHVERDRPAALHPDLLVPDVERHRTALVQVSIGVGRVDRLQHQVLDVGVAVRGAPGDPGVVSEDDAGDPRE